MDDLIAYTISGQMLEAAELCKAGKMDELRNLCNVELWRPTELIFGMFHSITVA